MVDWEKARTVTVQVTVIVKGKLLRRVAFESTLFRGGM